MARYEATYGGQYHVKANTLREARKQAREISQRVLYEIQIVCDGDIVETLSPRMSKSGRVTFRTVKVPAVKRTYETCGKSFTSRGKADRYARNIANASGIRVPVFETTGFDAAAQCLRCTGTNTEVIHGNEYGEHKRAKNLYCRTCDQVTRTFDPTVPR